MAAEYQPRKYAFPTDPIPTLPHNDPMALKLLEEEQPVILTGSGLAGPAFEKWSIEYLKNVISPSATFTTFYSNTGKFMYHDEDKKNGAAFNFVPPTSKKKHTFKEFVSEMDRLEAEDSSEKVYLQEALTTQVGPVLQHDFAGFQWQWEAEQQTRLGWGALTSNLLLVGMPGVITPCHYDEQQNFLTQVRGRKRVILFGPECGTHLYPYPLHHPCDRQSMVDFDHPDPKKFPKFFSPKLRGWEGVLEPGSLLYIPMYWWHYVESLERTVSVTFWHKGGEIGPVVMPLNARQLVAVRRNVEKMIGSAVGDANVTSFLREMVDGRHETESEE